MGENICKFGDISQKKRHADGQKAHEKMFNITNY